MPNEQIAVGWQVALDPGMRCVVRQGIAVARPETGHSVRILVGQLPPNQWLYYRFVGQGKYRGHTSRVGRTRTFPGRSHQPVEIFSVEDYRTRYALYRLDAHLQDAHARFPFIVTPDDHEVDNNYAGLIAEEGAPYQGDAFAERRKNAYQVYAETMPVRTLLAPQGNDFQVFRRLQFGDLADIHVLDTRQFRTDQPAEEGFGTTDTGVDPATAAFLEQSVFGEKIFDAAGIVAEEATLTGARQAAWLALNLLRSRSKWNVLALVPMEGDPLFTDAVASIARGFNQPAHRDTLDVRGIVTGAPGVPV